MYIAIVPNRHSRPAVLLRESYREEGKVKNRTLGRVHKTCFMCETAGCHHMAKGIGHKLSFF